MSSSDNGLSTSDSASPPPSPIPTTKKRKAPTSTTTTKAKRTKKTQPPDPFANAKEEIHNALASPNSFIVPADEADVRSLVLRIAEYAKSLEGSVAAAGSSGQAVGPPPKTAEQIKTEAERVRSSVNRGITKLMSWKPTCKQGRASFVFDGVCPDPRVFGAVLGLDGPPTFKARKYSVSDFCDIVGDIRASARWVPRLFYRYNKTHLEARYSYLYLRSDVNVRWNPETGEFKMSGKYGVHSSD
ncbi:hypothetical protein FRC09_017341 [Ceratobasidium sp. 395]|nr:hypothetical protein FRC09_017341 [Ceratobasidium sp. 395]